MSSILDALKKLEEEKAEAARATPVEFEDDAAERDLVRGGRSPQVTIQFSPMTVVMMLVGVIMVIVLVMSINRARSTDAPFPASTKVAVAQSALPAAVTPLNANSQTSGASTPRSENAPPPVAPTVPAASAPPTLAESAPPAAVSVPPVELPPPPIRIARASSGDEAALKASGPAPAARSKTIVSVQASSKETALSHKTVVPSVPTSALTPASRDATLPDPPGAAVDDRIASPASVKTRPSSASFDMYALPILTESDKLRLGLKGMEVNMLRSPNKNRPNPSAIINMQQVYVNETIQGTKAKLIGVDVRGIAIEVGGERFFVRR